MVRKVAFLLLGLLVMVSCRENRLSYAELEKKMLVNLVGTWQADEGQNFEEWMISGDSTYFATSYSLKDGEKIIIETIRIVREGGEIFYEAALVKQNEGKPIRFELIEQGNDRMTFFNASHDFPRMILYEFLDNDRMVATVSDGKGATGKSFTIKFKRVMKQKKVTGIGGIFFKSNDPEKIRIWYRDNLGLVTNEYGSLFEFRESDNPERKAYLQWSPFSAGTKYFEPSTKEFMINYRVENLEWLMEELKNSGVTILDTIEVYEYGKFLHIMDPEGNKIELWEPVDNEFTKSYEGETTK